MSLFATYETNGSANLRCNPLNRATIERLVNNASTYFRACSSQIRVNHCKLVSTHLCCLHSIMVEEKATSLGLIGSNSIQLQPSLSLYKVLYLPNSTNNLIFIHRLTQYLNCADLAMGKMIELAKEHTQRLIIVPRKRNSLPVNKQPQMLRQLPKFDFTIGILDIHYLVCLGLYFLLCLQKRLLTLFIVMFKNHHATFSPSSNKSFAPFDLVHSNVWRPIIDSIFRTKRFVSLIDKCSCVT
ncbi:hypothetical protein CR513_26855, partial [Mucuna pruriens]